MFQIGVLLAIIGLFFPIPLPFDDPVDFLGYVLMIVGMIKRKAEGG